MQQTIEHVFLTAWCIAAAFAFAFAGFVWAILFSLLVKAVKGRGDDWDDDGPRKPRGRKTGRVGLQPSRAAISAKPAPVRRTTPEPPALTTHLDPNHAHLHHTTPFPL